MRLPCEGQRRNIGSAGCPIARLYRVGEAGVGVLRRRTRVSISASPAHRLLMGRGTGEAKAKMGREITFTRGNVERCHFQYCVLATAGEHRDYLPGAAHGSAFRSQNKNIEVVKVLPIAPCLDQTGPDVRPEPRHRHWVQTMTMPRPRTRCGIGTQKAPRGQASNVGGGRSVNERESVRREKRQMPRWGFQGTSGSGARAGQGMARRACPRRARARPGWADYGTGKERFLLLLYHTGGGEIKGGLRSRSSFGAMLLRVYAIVQR